MAHKLSSLSQVAGKTFDFVIIGGGTAGLTLAARLSENSGTSVAVLEAGQAHLDDELVVSVQGWQRQFMNPEYDWKFPTVPQQNANGKTLIWSRGKGLGGSSAMNFLMWTRPQREDIDAFEALGNPGWNWERFYEYSKKTEKFWPASEAGPEDLYDKDAVGSDGPLSISFARTTSNAELPFRKSLRDSGINLSNDALSGSVLGAWKTTSVIDPVTNTRSYATNAYLLPAIGRPNLHVLTEAYVTKIVTSKSDTGEVVAQGVEFQHDGSTHVVHVAKEAILSAGTIKSPQILELSGIGDRAVLEPLGVPVQVDIPSVGTNVQEHITHNAMAFLMHEDRGIVTSDLLRDPAFLANFVESNPDFKGLAFTGLNFVSLQSISSHADEIISELEAKLAREAASYPLGLKEQYEQQLKHLKDPNVPDVEIMVTPFSFNPTPATKPIIAILPTLIHPFSRGTIHASSPDPTAPPAIDPQYFAQDADLAIFTEAWKFARKVAHIYPDFRLHEPLFAPSRADGDRSEWRSKLDGIMERAAFCKDKRWVCYRGQTGQNVVLANATFKGNPPADHWVDDACMSDGVSTVGLATAPADAAINTLATQAEYDAAFPVGTLLIATTPDSWSFQHFLDRITHIVAQGHHFTFGQSAPELVAGRPPGGAVSEMYDMLGLGGGKVHFRQPRLAAKKVVFSCRSPLVHPWLSLRSLEMFGLDPVGIPIDQRKKVVYVSRSHGSTSNGGRRVRNEDELLKGVRALLAMRDQGEELVLLHELGLSSQPQIMAWFHENVRAVIGPHGGGLYHHRWTGRDTLLLELMPRSWTSHMFWEEAGMLGQTYANVLLEPVSKKSTNMEADIPAVLEILSAQLGKSDARGVGLERLYRWHAPELLADEQ